MERRTITIDWRKEDSIRKGEDEISKLVNEGWNLVDTIAGFIKSTLIYEINEGEE